MPTPAENIQTAIDNISAQIASITANPQPDYSIQGVSLSFSSYLAMLTKQLADLQDALIFLSGPYELRTIGVS